MAQIASFDKGFEPPQTIGSPELARTFEASLSLGAGRFNRTVADGQPRRLIS